ncbi:response regulator transcription factor [Tepidibacter thalassicus]|uniref:Stage 0 sporulation protein A homolog n=1 Tax=Tepidibacter thalassicus DSM 15285 TaxID=1123350 RepID=A0A1M5S0P3_9FIRM|nr:response regulator transcription factor [Tepidibacter thalassicus]SHH31971.1 DNA-binding response regulator, OmpR family, contains REC and winged-helix (wHTH) domain [Tepidibacter thalassicus DSM 15285]
MNINILIAEDEEDIRNLLVLHLSKEGYNIFEASNGIEALKIFYKEDIDLLLLDVMMPKMDGFKVLTKVRETSQIPVIFLTARSEECDKVLGLGLGADDYVVKPFSIIEITSRVQAQLRRYINYSQKESKYIITNGDLILDLKNYVLKKNNQILDLNPKEFKIISVFMENIGKVYTKKQLYELVWENIYYGDDNTIMVHISHLREKIEDNPKKPKYLKTIRGIGYRMEKCNE